MPIQNLIYEIRGQKVMLDSDLAMLYGVETKRLNEAVKRNVQRFPLHYMFQLTHEEYTNLRSQIATSNIQRGGRRYMPYVFTEQGVAMLSSVLNSEKAIQINIQIIDTFVKIRKWAVENKNKNNEIEDLRKMLMLYMENTDKKLDEHSYAISQIISVLNGLIESPKKNKTDRL